MMDIRELIKTKRTFFDGGTGTVLQKMGLKPGERPEEWNLTCPEKVVSLHSSYIASGSNFITTNTFGVNSDKYPDYEKYIKAAVKCAKTAVKGFDDRFVAYDIGPLGRLLKPMGDLDFEEAYSIFKDSVVCAEKCGVDLYIIETMNDIYETKAALLAVKENSKKPVFVTNAYDENGRLMTGADVLCVVSVLEGMGADAIGVNCSFGPDKTLGVIKEYAKYASVPLVVSPNAGLPKVVDGKTVYDITPDRFAEIMKEIANAGGCILGGCCGTTPEHIEKTVKLTKKQKYVLPEKKNLTAVCSYSKSVLIDKKPLIIGERINPTGKKLLKEALRNGNTGYILGEAISQTEKGAHILDVNVGLPDIDEEKKMCETVFAIQSVTDTPLQLDSPNPLVLEKAMRIYNGVPLINSVDGTKEKMKRVFTLMKKYGGVAIALTMDEKGIPSTAAKRVAIAEKILKNAQKCGLSANRFIFDPLCMAVSADKNGAKTTLDSVKMLSERGYKTCLGVSNVSFGLPARDKLNMSFYALALENGLSVGIINPCNEKMSDVYHSFVALKGFDENFEEYIAYSSDENIAKKETQTKENDVISLKDAVKRGLKEQAKELAKALLEKCPPLEIINGQIIPALNEIGKAFEEKKAFLPQLLMSAEAANSAFEIIKTALPPKKSDEERKVILATVEGDIHDIGKNIVKVLLESYSFKVFDLGRDVAPEKVLECVKETGCLLVGLSALMTTTVPAMEKTIKLLHSYNKKIKVAVGGAVLNEEYAKMIKADKYCREATDTVKYAEKYYS